MKLNHEQNKKSPWIRTLFINTFGDPTIISWLRTHSFISNEFFSFSFSFSANVCLFRNSLFNDYYRFSLSIIAWLGKLIEFQSFFLSEIPFHWLWKNGFWFKSYFIKRMKCNPLYKCQLLKDIVFSIMVWTL